MVTVARAHPPRWRVRWSWQVLTSLALLVVALLTGGWQAVPAAAPSPVTVVAGASAPSADEAGPADRTAGAADTTHQAADTTHRAAGGGDHAADARSSAASPAADAGVAAALPPTAVRPSRVPVAVTGPQVRAVDEPALAALGQRAPPQPTV